MVNWERLFNKKDIDAQIAVFNKTILNVFRNYVPNKYIYVDEKDPVWMNESIKLKIKAKNIMYKKYIQSGRLKSNFLLLQILVTGLNELINTTEAMCYENLSKRLNNSLLQAKVY